MKTKITLFFLLAAMLLTGCGKEVSVVDITSDTLTVAKSVGAGSSSDVMEALEAKGLATCDITDNISTANPNIIKNWFSQGKTGTLVFYLVCTDGGFIRYDLSTSFVTQTRVIWKDGGAQVSYCDGWAVESTRLTDRGWLIIKRVIPDNPASQSLHDGYLEPVIMVRVSPLDEVCRQLQNKYIAAVGYASALFAADWDKSDMAGADLNGAFIRLYDAMYGKTVAFDDCPWPYDEQTDTADVPAEIFEAVIGSYFDLPPAQIKLLCGYNAVSGTYPAAVSGLDNGRQSVPVPDVTGYEKNTDGTISIYVSAVDVHGATDSAFSHTVTVRPTDNGFVFVSNKMAE